jgi:class 3 adenylate cyclase
MLKKIILAAFEIIDFVEQSKNIVVENRINFKVRIGVNSGLCCRIVGTKSLPMTSGETVNIASRMESNSVTGKINISENTFQLKIILLVNTEAQSKK